MISLPILVASALLLADTEGQVLQGVVQDAQGQPLAEVRVDIATAAPRVGQGLFCPSCYVDCKKSTRTDKDGRFHIAGLDPSLKFRVLFTTPGKATHLTKLVDLAAKPLQIVLKAIPTDVPPEQLVLGQVVDDQGVPIEGALIEPDGAKTLERRWMGQVKQVQPTATDTHGRFALQVPKEFLGLDIEVTADGHAGNQMKQLEPGPTVHKISVPTGTRVRGQLVHQGKPLASKRVSVVQLERNSNLFFIGAVASTTDSDGTFSFENLPADETYVIFSVVGEGPQEFVLTTKKFKAAGNHQERDLGMLETIPSLTLAGRLETPDGKSIPRGTKIALGRAPAWDLISASVDKNGEFKIAGLPPETYTVRVSGKNLQLESSQISHQLVGENTFGVKLISSIEDLRIPVQTQE